MSSSDRTDPPISEVVLMPSSSAGAPADEEGIKTTSDIGGSVRSDDDISTHSSTTTEC